MKIFLTLILLFYSIRILSIEEKKVYYSANNNHGCEIYGNITLLENNMVTDSLINIRITEMLDKINFNECKF